MLKNKTMTTEQSEYKEWMSESWTKSEAKVQCVCCERWMERQVKMVTKGREYCVGCFAKLKISEEEYFVVRRSDFPLFEAGWSVHEELLLLEGI